MLQLRMHEVDRVVQRAVLRDLSSRLHGVRDRSVLFAEGVEAISLTATSAGWWFDAALMLVDRGRKPAVNLELFRSGAMNLASLPRHLRDPPITRRAQHLRC